MRKSWKGDQTRVCVPPPPSARRGLRPMFLFCSAARRCAYKPCLWTFVAAGMQNTRNPKALADSEVSLRKRQSPVFLQLKVKFTGNRLHPKSQCSISHAVFGCLVQYNTYVHMFLGKHINIRKHTDWMFGLVWICINFNTNSTSIYHLRNYDTFAFIAYILLNILTLLLVGFLEYVNWWGGAIRPPVRSRELTGRFRWDKRHSIRLIVNFQNHHKKSKKVEN